MGIKLLIANFAVLIDNESTLWARIFLFDKTNINMDIIKTVIPVKAFLKILPRSEKSSSLPKDFKIEKQREMLTMGEMKLINNCSTIVINRIIEAYDTAPLEIFPDIKYIVPIIGIKAFIIVQRTFIYRVIPWVNFVHTVNIVIDMQREDAKEKECSRLFEDIEFFNILNIPDNSTTIKIEQKVLITEPKPKNK